MRIQTALTLALIPSLIGCISDMEGDDLAEDDVVDEVTYGETTQALFGSTIYAGGFGTQTTILGEKGATHTCYLRGIQGSMAGTQGNWGDRISSYAKVVLNASTDRWEIRTKAGYGGPLYAHVSCTMTTANRKWISTVQGGAAVDQPVTPLRRCFLTEVSTYGVGMMHTDWDGSLPGVKAWTYGGTWRIGTWFAPNYDGNIDGTARGVCIDISGYGELGDHYISNADVMIYNSDASPWACGAYSIQGLFTSATAKATSYKQNNRWRAGATANTGVGTKCFY